MDTVETKYGKITGVNCGNYVVYRGIPYAKAPTGELRWKAPVEPDSFQGTYIANKFSAICPQRFHNPDAPQMGFNYGKEFYADKNYLRELSEDCLYLNIWVPASANENTKLPVAFYIHGGGLMGGYSSEIEFDGESYAQKGVILVTIGYRLGVLGFLAHPWLSAENPDALSGNYGILDQIASLKWVVENIASFGGDPDNITVFGQSAGCMSTQVLVSSDLTENMISKAILQSGLICESDLISTPTLEEAFESGKRFVQMTGAASLDELRKIPSDKLLEYQDQFVMESMLRGDGLALVPCVDGYVLKQSVKDVYKNGSMKKIPYIAGFVGNDMGKTPEDFAANRYGILENECKCWAARVNEISENPVYLYAFDHNLPGDDSGPFHSSELWYMFGTLNRCWRPMEEADMELSEQMVTYWTDFIKSGSPDKEAKTWQCYTSENPFIKIFK